MITAIDRPATVAPSVLDALMYPDDTAAALAAAVPQGLLVEALIELAPGLLGADGRIDALVAVERHIAMLQARSSELLSAIDVGDATEDGWARESVAAALRVPPASMKSRMSEARDLAERLPTTLELVRAGEISLRHATDLVDSTRSLSMESVALVEAAVLGRAPEQTAAQFRASVKRAVLRVTTPATEEAAHAHAVTRRRVIFTPVEHGMTELWALLPADRAARLKATLDAMAHRTIHQPGGDPRTADQRRADALIDLAHPRSASSNPAHADPAHASSAHADPAHADPAHTNSAGADSAVAGPGQAYGHGQRPAVQVTIAASTLMGLDDQPGELDGYGPITARMARRIAADPTATWRRLLTDDRGHVRHASTTSYRPTAGIIATVLARDQHCTFPGCRRAARHNDLDHVQAWQPGEHTTTAGMTSLCRRHHRLKHSGSWRVERDDPSGVMTWTDKAGRIYRSRPPTMPTTVPTTAVPTTVPTTEVPTTEVPTTEVPTTGPTSGPTAVNDLAATAKRAVTSENEPPPPF